jgi:predicted RNA binding protein YcfA (HicA-like mRNA interferase family)
LGEKIRKDIQAVKWQFAEENQQICLPHLPSKSSDVWGATPFMFYGISNIKGRVNYVIPRHSPLVARMRLRPILSHSKLVKKLVNLAHLEFVRSGGNHDIYQSQSGRTIPIPRHPRDLGRGLIRQIIRDVGLDMELDEFLAQ